MAATAPTVHEEIIRRGFRETGKKAGGIIYTRGTETIRHCDYGPSTRWPHNPDANRHVLQYFRDGNKVSGGTAWHAILSKHVDAHGANA